MSRGKTDTKPSSRIAATENKDLVPIPLSPLSGLEPWAIKFPQLTLWAIF